MSRATTLKDIALAAEVSRAVVSDILNNKGGRFRPETQIKIKKLAREMNYRPNRLARAMISGISPIVVLSLHVEDVSFAMINLYLHDIVPTVAFALNKAGLEMLFLPFTTHAEQCCRLDELISEHLIGGVISNFIPGSQDELATFLHNKNLPFVLLGQKVASSAISVYSDQREITNAIKNHAHRKGLNGQFVHLMFSPTNTKQLIIRNGDEWRECTAKDEEIFRANSGILFMVPDMSVKQYLIKHKKIALSSILLVHDDRIPVISEPVLLVKSLDKRRAEKASELVAKWMACGVMPSQRQWPVITKKEHLTLLE